MEAPKGTYQIRTQKEAELISEIKTLADASYQKLLASLDAKGFVHTRELRNSVWTETKAIRDQAIYSIKIGFKGYGQLKDLRQMHAGVDIEALLAYVQSIGLENFKYVPGYYTDARRRKPIDKLKAETRIAWGIAMARKRQPILKRRGKGWFNPIKGKLEYAFIKTVSEKLAETAHKTIFITLQD